jgi:hypothetical protein
MSDPAFVVAIYRFRPDVTDETVADLMRRHRGALERASLVTERLPTILRSRNGQGSHRDFIEIFEWRSDASVSAAHEDPAIQEIWIELESLTTQPAVPLKDLAEADRPFAHFAPFPVTYAAPRGAATPLPRKRDAARRKAPKKASKKAPARRRPASAARKSATRPAKKSRRGRRR